MAWAKLSTTTLSGTADNISSGTITAKTTLQVMALRIPSGGDTRFKLTFNNDSGNNYSQKHSTNDANDSSDTTIPFIEATGNSQVPSFSVSYIINVSAYEKLVIEWYVDQNTAGTNTPNRLKILGKWTNKVSQITEIDFDNTSAGDLASGTTMAVLGTD